LSSIKQNNPLVSIIVVTYNSSKYVLETLESAKAQTYQNIELIITDDGSQDDTVQICRKWMDINKKRFLMAELISVDKNTGISSNCNRGAFRATGEWIKLIAGDDRLKSNCIEQFILASQNNNSMLYLSGYLPFNDVEELHPMIPDKNMFKGNSQDQLKKLMIKGTTIAGSTFFINKEVFRKLDGFSEKYPFCEDSPFAIKLLKNGFSMDLVPEILIEYRKHDEGISFSQDSKFLLSFKNHIIDEIFPILKSNKMYFYLWHYKLRYYIEKRFSIKKNIIENIVVSFLKMLDPVQISIKLKYILRLPPIYSDIKYNLSSFEKTNSKL
jgi:glycosyltransferase involved in cell wall biosynthesis